MTHKGVSGGGRESQGKYKRYQRSFYNRDNETRKEKEKEREKNRDGCCFALSYLRITIILLYKLSAYPLPPAPLAIKWHRIARSLIISSIPSQSKMRNLIRHKRERWQGRPQGKCFGTSASPLLHNKYAKEGGRRRGKQQ